MRAALVLLLTACAGHREPAAFEADPAACFERLATTLSDDRFEGRGLGTKGLGEAGALIGEWFAAAGLEVSRQPFEVPSGVKAGPGNALESGEGTPGRDESRPYEKDQDWAPFGWSSSGAFSGDVVFAGYGLRAGEIGYDDYEGVDVAGKVVLALRFEPQRDDPHSVFDGRRATRWSDLRYKAIKAREAGAAALIFVDPTEGGALPGLRIDGPELDAGLPVLQVSRAVADGWLAGAGTSVAAVVEEIDASGKPASRAIPGLSVSGAVDLVPTLHEVFNVVGVRPGKGSLAGEVVVVGAHYDHLGYGGHGSLAPDSTEIHNGADDNASGVAAMICALARSAPDGDRRTLVAVAFTAEEIGLGGSAHYVRNPARPIEDTVAMVNLDMVGRLRDDALYALGVETSEVWRRWLDAAAGGLTISGSGDGYGPSDQASFYAKGIPVLHLFTGAHEEYHTPADDAPTLNVEGGGKVAGVVSAVLGSALTEAERPTVIIAQAGPTMAGDSRGSGAWLGTVPDYATMGNESGGVLLSGVRAGGPAEGAGLVGGDRIVGMAGREVRNLYDLTFVLQDHRPGDVLGITVVRGEETLELSAILATRPASSEGSPHGGSPHHGAAEWAPKAGTDASHLLDPRETHLADLRKLTSGGENAEAYWSPDGRKLIFQRTAPEGGCDQQYVLDLETGETTLVSSGKGRTTCGYFEWPRGDRVIYATTEGASPECPTPPDRSKGYVWPLDEYDLVWDDKGVRTPFLASPGYDAEATVCFTDGRIVFTSVRDGDLDLYTVNPDGSDLKRLTDTPGYDGGAFFTPDCSEIVWRASRPEGDELADYQALLAEGLVRPSQLDIYVMKADGTDVRRLTDNGAANFGPYPTPDGKVIFSSNLGGSPREFDLWIVGPDGGAPEQITHTAEFDGFPMFSPDGKWLVFGSNRGGERGETNVFVARWVP